MNRPVREKLSSKSLSLIGIPKKFHSMTIGDFSTFDSEYFEDVKNFMTNYLYNIPKMFRINRGVYFYGSNGVGKTFLSCLIAKEAYRNRYTTRRVTFVEYIDLYTRVWNARSLEEKDSYTADFYMNYKSVEFLILEEVGKEIDSKVSAPILEDCLRYREDNGLVTIICTNLNIQAMKDRYGESCFSLLQGNMTPICLEGSDLRKFMFDRKENGGN